MKFVTKLVAVGNVKCVISSVGPRPRAPGIAMAVKLEMQLGLEWVRGEVVDEGMIAHGFGDGENA